MINHRHVAATVKSNLARFFEREGYKPKIEIVNLDADAGPRGSMVQVNFESDVVFEFEDIICYKNAGKDGKDVWRVVVSFRFGTTRYEMIVARKPYYVPIRRVNWSEVKGAKMNPAHYMFTTL